jgi:hypothetical protein
MVQHMSAPQQKLDVTALMKTIEAGGPKLSR